MDHVWASRLCLFLACCMYTLRTSTSTRATVLGDDAEVRLAYAELENDFNNKFTQDYQSALEKKKHTEIKKFQRTIAEKFLNKYIEQNKDKAPEGVRRATACKELLVTFATHAQITRQLTEQLFRDLNDKLYEYEQAEQESHAQRRVRGANEKHIGLVSHEKANTSQEQNAEVDEGRASENSAQPEPEQPVQEISVVLGGKLNQHPVSIGDTLVGMLVDRSAKVISASSSAINIERPRYQHVQGDLFNDISGYHDAISAACDPESYENIVFYFTLAKYSGTDKTRQIQLAEAKLTLNAAHLFALALTDKSYQSCFNRVHVVLTGTAATQPSDAKQKYKIGPTNFYYAVSKLAQAYELAVALGQEGDIPKMWMHLYEIIGAGGPMEEESEFQREIKEFVDPIAKQQKALMSTKFGVVDDLTIIFSSMHSEKYTENANKELLPFVSVFRDVLSRLNIAMSLKTAAYKHIVIADSIQGNSA